MKKAEEKIPPTGGTSSKADKSVPLTKIVVGRTNSISGNGAIIRKNLAQVRRGKVPEYWTKVVIEDET